MATVTYEIRRSWLECTEGTSDKFYSPFLIESSADHTITVAHYGARKLVGHNSFARPVNGGQIAIYPSRNKYQTLLHEKGKKGYVEVGSERTARFTGEADFIRYITEQFGSTRGHEILRYFGLNLDGAQVPAPPPTPEPEDQSIEDRPDGWGSW
jgi:hypothetical protein